MRGALAAGAVGGVVDVTSRRQSRRLDDELAYMLRRRRRTAVRASFGVAGIPVEDRPGIPVQGPVGPAGPVAPTLGPELNEVLCMATTEGVQQHLLEGSYVCRSGQWRLMIFG